MLSPAIAGGGRPPKNAPLAMLQASITNNRDVAGGIVETSDDHVLLHPHLCFDWLACPKPKTPLNLSGCEPAPAILSPSPPFLCLFVGNVLIAWDQFFTPYALSLTSS